MQEVQAPPAASITTSPIRPFNPWSNQLGGFLYAQIFHEVYRSPETPVTPDPEHLYRKTKKIFLQGGLDELEHMQFRECRLKKLCLQKLWEITRELNPGHPRFQPEPDPDTENYDWSEPPLIEPQISRERLEEDIADWYIRNKSQSKTQQTEKIQQNIPTTNDLSPRAKSERENNARFVSDTNQESLCNTKKRDWRFISDEELEGPELNTEEICKAIHNQLKSQGNTHESLETINSALSGAQCKASRAHRSQGRALPIRLCKNSAFLLHEFALTSIGSQGRGKSSKYRKIKSAYEEN